MSKNEQRPHRSGYAALIMACGFALVLGLGIVTSYFGKRIPPFFAGDLNKWDKEYQEFVLKTTETLGAKRVIGPALVHEVTDSPWLEEGLVLDLGVFLGSSTRTLAGLMGNRTTVHGFDTFTGFPGGKEWYLDDFVFGTKFHHSERWVRWTISDLGLKIIDGIPSTMGYNIEFHRGVTFDTLAPVLDANPHKNVTFMHVDLDTYEGASHALETCRKRMIVGTTIVFDEFFVLGGEMKAFYDFQQKYSFNYTLTSWGHDVGLLKINGFWSALGFVYSHSVISNKVWQVIAGLSHTNSWTDYAIMLMSHCDAAAGLRITSLGKLHSD